MKTIKDFSSYLFLKFAFNLNFDLLFYDYIKKSPKDLSVIKKMINLRKMIYIDEKQWEQGENDLDEYDQYSQGIVISDIFANKDVACARLILKKFSKKLPIEKYISIPQNINVAEISRFSIIKEYRSQQFLGTYPFAFIIFLSLLKIAIDNNLTHFVFYSERSLAMMLKREGFDVLKLDDIPIEHKGIVRYPYILNITQYTKLKEFQIKNPDKEKRILNAFDIITETMDTQLQRL